MIILDLLDRANGPISAYAIADRACSGGARVVPNQVYRTVGRLIHQDKVHRVESLSAYLLKRGKIDALLICESCHSVRVLADPEIAAALNRCAEECGFAPHKLVVESHGWCAECARPARHGTS
jgi:Fur family transcriptional regulator, zinc uptake regulator